MKPLEKGRLGQQIGSGNDRCSLTDQFKQEEDWRGQMQILYLLLLDGLLLTNFINKFVHARTAWTQLNFPDRSYVKECPAYSICGLPCFHS
jgi:hypothetical protein